MALTGPSVTVRPLLTAQDVDEITEAFRSQAEPYAQEFAPRLSKDILNVIREKKFPKKPKAQIRFLADSLAGRPNVEARTSRDICGIRLAQEKQNHLIRSCEKCFMWNALADSKAQP
jgi:hypothetical protein